MPKLKITKSAIDALPVPTKDTIYWDAGCPGFGIKVTPNNRKVFLVLYRVAGAGTRVRKYTIGPYGRVTLQQARIVAQRIFSARLEGRDLATEKQEARRRLVADRVEDVVEAYIAAHVSKRRTAREIERQLRREIIPRWGARSVHQITKRDVNDLIMSVMHRGTPAAANSLLKVIKAFFGWCIARAILDSSPTLGLRAPAQEVARERVLSDNELVRVIKAARQIGYPYGPIVELLALTGQRRAEIAELKHSEIDLDSQPIHFGGARTKNLKPHIVHLSRLSLSVLETLPGLGSFVFCTRGDRPFQDFSTAKRELDRRSGVTNWRLHDLRRTCVSGMARLGIAPHVADKILNHQGGTIAGVAAVYQRYEFLTERKFALDLWDEHIAHHLADAEALTAAA